MKSTINISLDTEIIAKLREEHNYSDLINREMDGYYNSDKSENVVFLKQKLAEIKQISKINNKKKRLIEKKLLKIREKEKKILEKRKKTAPKKKPDPILDPIKWIESGWDKRYPDLWQKHIEFKKAERRELEKNGQFR